MSEPYVPTTEEVRSAHRYLARDSDADWRWAEQDARSDAEFDRWLAEHDRQVAERAWGAGYFVGLDREGYHGPDLNPHRAAKGEQK